MDITTALQQEKLQKIKKLRDCVSQELHIMTRHILLLVFLTAAAVHGRADIPGQKYPGPVHQRQHQLSTNAFRPHPLNRLHGIRFRPPKPGSGRKVSGSGFEKWIFGEFRTDVGSDRIDDTGDDVIQVESGSGFLDRFLTQRFYPGSTG
jgi:hypothetical protein